MERCLRCEKKVAGWVYWRPNHAVEGVDGWMFTPDGPYCADCLGGPTEGVNCRMSEAGDALLAAIAEEGQRRVSGVFERVRLSGEDVTFSCRGAGKSFKSFAGLSHRPLVVQFDGKFLVGLSWNRDARVPGDGVERFRVPVGGRRREVALVVVDRVEALFAGGRS